MTSPRCVFLLLFALCLASSAVAEIAGGDWPQWQGPSRDGISPETGLRKRWPDAGPPERWKISGLGEGYGSPSIQGDRILVQGSVDKRDSVLFCLNRADGSTLWVQTLGPRLDQDMGPGPRGTPTLDGDRVYTLTENGNLSCRALSDGAELWAFNILSKFDGRNITWHISESPLVDGDMLVVTPGGPDACVVALDKMTGDTLWTSKGLSHRAGYASCIARDIHGIRTILAFTAEAGVGIRASDGLPMWEYRPAANGTANITTPVFHDNRVFFTSAYDTGCGLVELTRAGDRLEAKEVYFNREMQNHHGGVVLVDGYLYGFSNNILKCLEFATGREVWKDRSVGKGAVTWADGMLYLLSEDNNVGLAVATPEGYRERGRFRIEDTGRQSWAHPVVAGKKLYIRNQHLMMCYDIAAQRP